MYKKPCFLLFFLVFCYCIVLPLAALDSPVRNISDDSTLRISIKDTWLTEVPARVLLRSAQRYNLPGGGRVELRTEAGENEFSVILARELTGISRENSGNFPGWAQGSWLITRERRTPGTALRIRIFLRSDPNTYIQFRPLGNDKCLADIVLYEAFVAYSVQLPVPLERLYTLPLSEVLAVAGSRLPLKYFDVDPALYRDTRKFIADIREGIKNLEFADDGAIDENGNYVFIETGLPQTRKPGLNCSGFAKWLVDRILFPHTGKFLLIEPLKARFGQRGTSFTEPWEDIRDPFFGLDWIRNLASSAASVLRSPAFATLDEIEVRAEPFSLLRTKNGIQTPYVYPGFLQNAGYGIEGLQPLLYTLAIDEPNRIYLAALNNEAGPPTTPDNLRGRPRLRQYFHVAVLIPYFNEYGAFQVTVFESAAETSFNAFRTRYPGQHVNLVRVPIQ